MFELVKAVRSSTFLRHNAIFFFGSLLVGVLNYAFYPIIGRLLNVSDYGEVQALVSLFAQLTIFLTVLSQVSVNVVANYQDEDKKQRVILELEKVGFLVGLVLLVIGVFLSKYLKSFFHFTSVWPFDIMLLAFLVTIPFTFRGAFLKGHRKFGQLSIANVLSAGSEIVISASLVLLGFGAGGAIGGLVVAQGFAFVYAAHAARRIGFHRPDGTGYFDLPDWKTLAPEAKYSLFILVVSLVVTVFSTIDIFVAKHYFSPVVAGRYAGVSIVARSIYFLTAPIAQVLLPSVKIHNPRSENRQLLLKSFGLLFVLGGSATLVFSLFPRLVISILMGHKYLAYAHLLPLLSVSMLLLSFANMIISYCIALRIYRISVIVLLDVLGVGCLMVIRHASLHMIITNLVYGGVAMLGLFGLLAITSMPQVKVAHND